jgi:hypothetical protein
VSAWFDATVVIKLIFIGVGLFLARRQRLFLLLFIPLTISLGLTIVQVITNNTTLALIFPWRLSTWLVPVSVGLISAWFVTTIIPRVLPRMQRPVKYVSLALIGLAVAAGMLRTYLEQGESAGLSSRGLEAYVAENRQTGQIYLTPRSLYDFRLEAGVPIYVDFLSIPYKYVDVLEWDARFRATNIFYQWGLCEELPDFYAEGITHVVLPVDFPKVCPQLVEIYADPAYKLYELKP